MSITARFNYLANIEREKSKNQNGKMQSQQHWQLRLAFISASTHGCFSFDTCPEPHAVAMDQDIDRGGNGNDGVPEQDFGFKLGQVCGRGGWETGMHGFQHNTVFVAFL
jgi:hypothetical protein